MPELLTIEELTEKIKFNKYTIYRWVKAKKIPYVRMPGNDLRFSKDKIETWIESRTINQKNFGR